MTNTAAPLSSPSRPSSSGLKALDKVLASLGRSKDFEKADAAGTPDEQLADQLVMLSAAELDEARLQKETGALESLISTWRTRCVNARLQEEQQWLKNMDMYMGRHFTSWSTTEKRMKSAPNANNEVRIPVSFIQPVCRTELAKTSSSHPIATVLPASNDNDDILAARAGEQVWGYFYDVTRFQHRVFNPTNFWRTITGNGFAKVFYDQHKEDKAATEAAMREWRAAQAEQAKAVDFATDPMMGMPLITPAPPKPKPEPIMGAVDARMVTPFHLLVPDLAEEDIQEQEYVLHQYTIGREKAKAIYGKFMPEGWMPSVVSPSSIMDLHRLGLEAGNPAREDATLVVEAWIKPNVTPLLPKGGLVVLVDGRIVSMSRDGMPYSHGEFPFHHVTGVPTGRFYRKSVIEPLIPLQNEVNRTFAQLIQYKNLAVLSQFFYRAGSLDPTKIRPKPGQYIPVTLGFEYPTPVPLSNLPTYIPDLMASIKAHVDDISGQHQVSRAISPGADTAASAISILREADDDFLSPTIDSIEAFMESVGRHALALMAQFWEEPRLVKVTGDSESVSARTLTGAEFATGTDIRVQAGSGLPESKSARIATITEWITAGIIPANVGLKAMESGTLGRVYRQLQIDEDQAEYENVEMEAVTEEEYLAWEQEQQQMLAPGLGMPGAEPGFEGLEDPAFGMDAPIPSGPEAAPPAGPPADPTDPAAADPMADPMAMPAPPIFYPINEFDNDPVHLQVHERQLKSQAYKTWPTWKQNILLDHWRAHVSAGQAKLAMNMAAEANAAATSGAAEELEDGQNGQAPAANAA